MDSFPFRTVSFGFVLSVEDKFSIFVVKVNEAIILSLLHSLEHVVKVIFHLTDIGNFKVEFVASKQLRVVIMINVHRQEGADKLSPQIDAGG